MKYKWNDLMNSYTKKKRQMSSVWARLFSRPISFVLTYFLINIGVTANAVSVIAIIDALLSCILIASPYQYLRIVGVFLFALWHVLDCVDGNIARVKHESSYMGEYIDALSGYTASSFVFLSIGIAAYYTSTMFVNVGYWIMLGGFASVAETYTRLIHNRYTVAAYRRDFEITNSLPDIKQDDPEGKRGLLFIGSRIRKTFGFSALFIPFLILALIFNRFDILVIFYSIYNICWMLITMFIYTKRACCK